MRLMGLLLAGAGLLAAGPGHAAPPAYTLRYKFRTGQVDRYSIQFTMRAAPRGAGAQGGGVPPNPGSVTSVLRVLRVNKDGSAQVAFSMGGMRTAAAGQTTSPPETVTYTMSPDGRVSDFQSRRGGGVTSPGGGLVDMSVLARMSALLPPRAVMAGDRWSSAMPSPVRGGKPIRVESRLLSIRLSGLTKSGSQRVARLKQFVAIPLNITIGHQGGAPPAGISGSLALTTITDFSVDAGKPLSGTVDGGGVVTFKQASGPQNGSPMALDLRVHANIALVK